jgi:hypothetical protein
VIQNVSANLISETIGTLILVFIAGAIFSKAVSKDGIAPGLGPSPQRDWESRDRYIIFVFKTWNLAFSDVPLPTTRPQSPSDRSLESIDIQDHTYSVIRRRSIPDFRNAITKYPRLECHHLDALFSGLTCGPATSPIQPVVSTTYDLSIWQSRCSIQWCRSTPRCSAATRERVRTIMFVGTKNSHARPKVANRSYVSSLLVALVFALTINPNKIQAQIFNDVRINVPFQCAGNARHPVGEYRIHMLDRWVPTTLQISSGDEQTSNLFQVEQTNTDLRPRRPNRIRFDWNGFAFGRRISATGKTD